MKGAIGSILMGIFICSAVLAQAPSQPSQSQKDQASPLYRVTVVARSTKAINYSHRGGSTKIDFRGTMLFPFGRGQANIEGKRGALRIQAQFDKMQPATMFGPEYLTYVLWAITPEGRAANLGEVVLQGAKSKLEAATELQAFALIVTAEPYFAVTQPSDVVVLENVVRPDTAGRVQEVDAKFELLQRGQYGGVSADAQPMRMEHGVPLALYEARNAVQIAEKMGAERYALTSFQKAQQLLAECESALRRKGGAKKQVEMTAREAAQTAEDARVIAVKRQEEERLARERQAAAEREAQIRADAEHAKLEAQLAAERAARERAEAEAARAAALLQQQAAQTEAERAREVAARATAERADADAARTAALAQQAAAQADADRARQSAAQSERLRQQAEAEKAELRSRLLNQLNVVLQTRDTARGLIVSMSDVLFNSGSYTLRPAAREKLAKVSGILLAHPGLNLQIEGHTDSVGSDQYNQQLSEQRASAVRDFLVQQGIASGSATARGFGKTQPVSSNDSAAGRAQNRRVELVVTGDAIGATQRDVSSPRTMPIDMPR